jgi:serine/threonine protein phosphatase PrpC
MHQWLSVHDGHGGSEAVDQMEEWMKDVLKGVKNEKSTWSMANDTYAAFMSKRYYELMETVKDKRSGAVSISALCTPGVIYIGWVGDCQGCVFNDSKILDNVQCNEIDFAESGRQTRVSHRAESTPHCFSSIPKYTDENKDVHEINCMERYDTRDKITIVGFGRDEKSQAEYEKIQRAHSHKAIEIDSTYVVVGSSQRLLVDVRLSGCVQPTRVLGDCKEHMALRHPTVMRVIRSNQQPYRVLLCSDGVFSRNAFSSMESLCQCVLNPLLFVKSQFYRRGQEMTERIIACDFFKVEDVKVAMYGQTWREFLLFLRNEHFPVLASDAFCGTFEDTKHHAVWLYACEKSIHWLESQHYYDGKGIAFHKPVLIANVAAHLAVVMGSIDNVTVMIAA